MTPDGPIENTPEGWYVTLEGHNNQLYTRPASQQHLRTAFSENRTTTTGEDIIALSRDDQPYSGGGIVGPFPIFSPPQIRRQSTSGYGGLDLPFDPDVIRGSSSQRRYPDSPGTSPMRPTNLLSQLKRIERSDETRTDVSRPPHGLSKNIPTGSGITRSDTHHANLPLHPMASLSGKPAKRARTRCGTMATLLD